jgi:serine/threonine protein kinase
MLREGLAGGDESGESSFEEAVKPTTAEHLIKRSGRLEVKVALEIATQVAAGLAAVHKQKLVHRDIKPSNIMVSVEEGGGTVTAKIIDLGLAKPASDAPPEAAISTSGAFAGTPEFASPEQFAGVGGNIRSDLYSLGVVLWEMLTGYVVFRGSPAEVMYQHLHAPLPLDLLENVPQPVVVLLDALLEKDPGRRFQNPAELLKAIPEIADAINARRRITRQNLQKTPSTASRVGTRRPKSRLGPKKISVARLPITGSGVFGREEDIAFLDAAWANHQVNVVTIVAWAGVGKSTLLNHWMRALFDERPQEIVADAMKRHGLSNPWPRFHFPDAFLKHRDGIGAFFNPDEGEEYMLSFNCPGR